MKIFVIGQTTMEMYRIEYGNIGNYYILEPFFRKLHAFFPNAKITTTLQLTERFCKDERVSCVPMEYYYDLEATDNEVIVDQEIVDAKKIASGGEPNALTPYLNEVLQSDLVIDFSGDIWGENASLLKEDRFRVGVKKNYVAQILGKFNAYIASSPGPFDENDNFQLTQQVFADFDFVGNREAESLKVLEQFGMNTSKVGSYACPAFLFQPGVVSEHVFSKYISGDQKILGFILCGFNFEDGPHNKWPRDDREYDKFVTLLTNFLDRHEDYKVVLMSHANGFKLPSNPFVQTHGSDYKHAEKMYQLLCKAGYTDRVQLLDEILSPHETKAFIKNFDLLISGRIHGAVAGFSQNVPTMVLDYGHEPKAHKTLGFVKNIGADDFFTDPNNLENMGDSLNKLADIRIQEKRKLKEANIRVQGMVEQMFIDLRKAFDEHNS